MKDAEKGGEKCKWLRSSELCAGVEWEAFQLRGPLIIPSASWKVSSEWVPAGLSHWFLASGLVTTTGPQQRWWWIAMAKQGIVNGTIPPAPLLEHSEEPPACFEAQTTDSLPQYIYTVQYCSLISSPTRELQHLQHNIACHKNIHGSNCTFCHSGVKPFWHN